MKKDRISEIITEEINKVIEERKEPLLEMATFGVERWGNTLYKIAVHGASTADRDTPHFHIYLNNDINPYTQFNFEISLEDILCKNEINLIFQHDRARNVNNRNRTECSWTGYREIKEGLVDFIFNKCPTNRFGEFEDNLARGIYDWNRETDYIKTVNQGINVLRLYFEEHNLVPLPQYQKYLKDYNLK